MLAILIPLILAVAPPEPVAAGSYVHLEGPRLARFRKTGGRSELGHLVTLEVPGKVLQAKHLRPFRKSRRWVAFEDRKIVFVASRTDPSLVQAQRKIVRSGGRLLVRGRVVRVKEAEGQPSVVVRVDRVRRTKGGS